MNQADKVRRIFEEAMSRFGPEGGGTARDLAALIVVDDGFAEGCRSLVEGSEPGEVLQILLPFERGLGSIEVGREALEYLLRGRDSFPFETQIATLYRGYFGQ